MGRRTVVCLVAFGLASAAATSAAPPAKASLEAVRLLLRTGQYAEARRMGDSLARRPGPVPATVATILAATAERKLGLFYEARTRLETATIKAPDHLPLRTELMRVADAVGDRGALKDLAKRTYRDLRAGRVDRKSPADLVAVAVAIRFDNNWDEANRNLREAVQLNGRFVEANLEWGETFLQKYAADNALPSFQDALKQDPGNPDAHVGLARALLEQGYDTAAADKALAAALTVNPRHAGALGLRGELALDGEDFDAVKALVAELRRTNPKDACAAWLSASRALLLDDQISWKHERDLRLALRPHDGDFFAAVAEALVRHRRYEEARTIAAEGVAEDGDNATLLASLGNTLLRLGDEKEGLAMLRRAWDRDPYNARTFNLLNLFDKVIPTSYVTIATTHLRFRVEPKARAAIENVVAPFVEDTYQRYALRYGFEPHGPIMFELYGERPHYAIRTVGLPRLGVSGVCFGRVITSQAPTNAAFNWGMVLAHELAHVFALELSRSGVPRWFTEGLAELETARLRPEWRRHNDLGLWAALATEQMPSLARLSHAFVHARNADDAAAAYLFAAEAMEFLERSYGFPKIRAALTAFAAGGRDAEVLEKVTGAAMRDIDLAFRASLEARLAGMKGQFFPTHAARLDPREAERRAAAKGATARTVAQAGLAQLAGENLIYAEAALARARGLPGGDHEPLVGFLGVELALAARNGPAASAELAELFGRGLDGYDLRLRAGLAAVRQGDKVAGEAHLRKAIAFAPRSVEAHAMLATLLRDLGRAPEQLSAEIEVLRLEPQAASLAKRVVFDSARTGDFGRAESAAEIAVFIDPADPDLWSALGRARAATGKAGPALQALERALLFAPADANAVHRTCAELYDKVGDRKAAAVHRDALTEASSPAGPPGPRPPRAPPPGLPPLRPTPAR